MQVHFLTLLTVLLLYTGTVNALEPHEILVIANKNAARSVGLAQYYMQKRNIPQSNLVELWITDREWCSRKDYEKRAVYKIRKHLTEKDPNNQIRCLVTMYGVPLKIMPPEMTIEENKQVEDLRNNRKDLNDRIKALGDSQKEQAKKLREELKTVKKRIDVLTKNDHRASFDSELALVLRDDYSLPGWVLNPFFIGFKNKQLRGIKSCW